MNVDIPDRENLKWPRFETESKKISPPGHPPGQTEGILVVLLSSQSFTFVRLLQSKHGALLSLRKLNSFSKLFGTIVAAFVVLGSQ